MKKTTFMMTCLVVIGMVTAAVAQPPGDGNRGGRGRGGPGGFDGRPGGLGGPPPNPILEVLDADQDGVLSAKEIENAATALKKLDKDGDGRISREEMRPSRGGGPGGDPAAFVKRLMEYDKDSDGKLSQDELPERMSGIISRVDENKDGFVDKDELIKMAKQFGQRAGRGGGRRGGGGPGGPGGERPRRPQRPE